MTAAEDLFEALKLAYDNDGLVTLTNVRDRTQNAIDETYGDATAQSVIDLWPAYAQVDYDPSNALHVEVAMEVLVALFHKRGGYSATIAEITWDQALEMFDRVKNTSPRGHKGPVTNSGVTTRRENARGRNVRGWSDPDSMPKSFLPSTTPASET